LSSLADQASPALPQRLRDHLPVAEVNAQRNLQIVKSEKRIPLNNVLRQLREPRINLHDTGELCKLIPESVVPVPYLNTRWRVFSRDKPVRLDQQNE
jgi:hypothetical protein